MFYARHMPQNFQKAWHRGGTLKNYIRVIARSTNIPEWQTNMDKLKVDSETTYEWIEQLVPNTWIEAFFNEFPKHDMFLKNHLEVFSRYLLICYCTYRCDILLLLSCADIFYFRNEIHYVFYVEELVPPQASGRGRTRRRGSYNASHGSAHYLPFGDD